MLLITNNDHTYIIIIQENCHITARIQTQPRDGQEEEGGKGEELKIDSERRGDEREGEEGGRERERLGEEGGLASKKFKMEVFEGRGEERMEEEVAFMNCNFSIKRNEICFKKCRISIIRIKDYFLIQRGFDSKSELSQLNRLKDLLQAEKKGGSLFEIMEDVWRKEKEEMEEERYAIAGFDGREPWKGVGCQRNGGMFVNMNEEGLVFSTDVSKDKKI